MIGGGIFYLNGVAVFNVKEFNTPGAGVWTEILNAAEVIAYGKTTNDMASGFFNARIDWRRNPTVDWEDAIVTVNNGSNECYGLRWNSTSAILEGLFQDTGTKPVPYRVIIF